MESKIYETATRDVTDSFKVQTDTARVIYDEAHQGFWTAVKLYPTAIGWSLFFSLGVIMLAFDPQLLGNLYATPAFQVSVYDLGHV